MQIVNAYCDKLCSFEVPLEDIFLENDVHPAIKNLFEIAFKSVSKSGFSISVVLTSYQGTLTERFNLKDQLITMGYFSGDEASPGAYLWLIKHFLGSLPLPLLPNKTQHPQKSWNLLCDICIKLLREPCSKRCSSFHYYMARYINGLSDANRMLVMNLLNLFRSLIDGSNDDNEAISSLANYFAPSLFIRPHYPGNGIKFCKNSYYFLIFLMIHWNVLRPLCKTPKGFQVQVFDSQCVQFTKIIRTSSVLESPPVYWSVDVKNFRSNKAIQTLSENSIFQQSLVNEINKESSDYKKESSPKSMKSSLAPFSDEEEEYFYDEDFKTQQNFQNELFSTDRYFGTSSNQQLDKEIRKESNGSATATQLNGEDEYFYDEDFNVQKNSFKQINDESLRKVGWTCIQSPPASPHIGWDVKKSLNFDETKSTVTSEKRSQKSISLRSIHMKLKCLRKIRSSLCNVRKSVSSIHSNIKYKKMDSSKSNSF